MVNGLELVIVVALGKMDLSWLVVVLSNRELFEEINWLNWEVECLYRGNSGCPSLTHSVVDAVDCVAYSVDAVVDFAYSYSSFASSSGFHCSIVVAVVVAAAVAVAGRTGNR